jgi:cytochrome c oxidase subunit II
LVGRTRWKTNLMKFHRSKTILVLYLIGVLLTGCTHSPSILDPHGTDANSAASLAWLMFAISGVVLIIVSLLLWMTFRRSRLEPLGHQDLYANDRSLLRNVVLGGAAAPMVVLLIIMGLAIGIENTASAKAAGGDTDIEVIGHQWWWEVHYPGRDFYTANEMHIPAGQTVTIHVTSADVIHSFWVPELHGKMDLIPGQTNTFTIKTDQAGVYRGQCAEFCGTQHAHMAFLVIAQSAGDYNAWLKEQTQPGVEPKVGSLEQQGQQAFLGSACVYCHTIRGTNASGRVGPDLTHLASRQTIASGILPNNPGNLAGWMINSQSIKPGNHMPPMNLNGDQVQALLAYLATLK